MCDSPARSSASRDDTLARPSISRRRRWLFRLIALIGTVCALGIVGEAVLRIADIGRTQNYAERLANMFMSTEGIKYRPDTRFDVTDIDFRTSVRINNLGFRGSVIGPKTAAYRVLCIGDSFTEAAGVEDEDLMSTVAARRLSEALGREVEVINLGVSGWNLPNYLGVLEKYGRLLEPDVIWINFCCDNDFVRSAPRADRRPVEPLSTYDAGPKVSTQEESGWITHLHSTLREHSRVYAYARLKLDAAFLWRFGLRAMDDPVGLAPMPQEERETIVRGTESWFKAIGRCAEKMTPLPVVVIAMPTMFQLDEQLAVRYRVAHNVDESDFDADGPTALLAECLEGAGVMFVNLLENYREADEPTYFPFYRHLNPAGSRLLGKLAAEHIAPLLRNRQH